ncbi:hypothetical protein ACS0TY_017820 [Phlomoides rotata]
MAHAKSWSVKVNVDAILFTRFSEYGVGMVARDATCYFLAGRTIWFLGVISVSEAELVGVYEAILWSYNMGFTSVVIEMDVKVVCDAINEKRIGNSTFGSYVSACIDLCSSFLCCDFNCVRRQANCVAHAFARVFRLYESPHTWVEPPDFVDGFLNSFCTDCE